MSISGFEYQDLGWGNDRKIMFFIIHMGNVKCPTTNWKAAIPNARHHVTRHGD